jgi:hypothetical protein
MQAELPDNTEIFIPGTTVKDPPCIPEEKLVEATRESVRNPMGMDPLSKLAHKGSTVVFVIPDIVKGGCQPTSHRKIAIQVILEELYAAGVEKKDILLLLQYSNDGDSWNMPVIFLQENPDNMMYLDYPNLESYKVEAKTENGTPFYRDTFFEEFLGKQHLTEKLSDMEGVWTDYVEYLDSISGATMDIQKQIEVFAQNRDKWATDIDFADEQYKFTLADLDMDGQVELLVSHSGGTGFFSYTSFYNVDKNGKLKELNTTFSEYESQPDLMDQVSDESDVMVYSNIINGKGYYNYIVYDLMKESPSSYVYRVSSLAIVDDVVTETKLAVEYETYDGPDYAATVSYKDYTGAELTEEEYYAYAAAYYDAQNAAEHQAHFQWKDVSDIVNASDEEAVQMLTEVYNAYSFD